MAIFRTAGRTVVGLELEPAYVAAAEVSVNGSFTVKRAAAANLPSGVLRDGEVSDVNALAQTLESLFAEHGLSRRVRIGIANKRIVMRTIDLPPLHDPKDLEAAVRFQSQEHVPMPLDQAVFDYHSLGIVSTASGERSRVVLVAARRDMVERVLAAATQAGLHPEGVDLSAFAMVRALANGTGGDGAVLYVSIGGLTNLALAVGSRCVFTRAVPGGLEAVVIALAERREMPLERAREWLNRVGLLAPVEEIDGEPEVVCAARDALEEGLQRIAELVRNSLDFHRSQDEAQPVTRVVLTGPAAGVPGFGERLSEQVSLPITAGAVPLAQPDAVRPEDEGRVAVAAGLAVSERPAA